MMTKELALYMANFAMPAANYSDKNLDCDAEFIRLYEIR